jgi:hypothetical protein
MSYPFADDDVTALRRELASVQERQEVLADALAAAGDEIVKLQEFKEALEKIAQAQPRVLRWLELNGIVFDGPLGADPTNWQHVAFSIYTDLCEVDTIARQALA